MIPIRMVQMLFQASASSSMNRCLVVSSNSSIVMIGDGLECDYLNIRHSDNGVNSHFPRFGGELVDYSPLARHVHSPDPQICLTDAQDVTYCDPEIGKTGLK